jgi:hypothetical protein
VAQENSVELLENVGFFPGEESQIVDNIEYESCDSQSLESSNKQSPTLLASPGFCTQVRMQFSREIANIQRDKSVLWPRLLQTALLATMIGTIFYKVGETSPAETSNLQSRYGAIAICCAVALLGTGQASLMIFPEERPIFLREYSTNHYSVVSYFVSHIASEAIISAAQMFVLVSCSQHLRSIECVIIADKYLTALFPGHHYVLHGRVSG